MLMQNNVVGGVSWGKEMVKEVAGKKKYKGERKK